MTLSRGLGSFRTATCLSNPTPSTKWSRRFGYLIGTRREPLTLNSNVLSIGGVIAWGCVNVISIPSLRQRGNLIPGQNITQALQDGLRRAVNQVLTTTPDLHDQDRLYFTIASNRLHNNFQGWGLRAGEWRQDTERVEALFHRLAQALNSNEQFEMDDSFQVSITQVHHAPQGTGKPRRGKPGHPTMEMLTKKTLSSGSQTTTNSVVPEPSWSPKPEWTSTRNGTAIRKGRVRCKERLALGPPSRSQGALRSLQLRRLDGLQ